LVEKSEVGLRLEPARQPVGELLGHVERERVVDGVEVAQARGQQVERPLRGAVQVGRGALRVMRGCGVGEGVEFGVEPLQLGRGGIRS